MLFRMLLGWLQITDWFDGGRRDAAYELDWGDGDEADEAAPPEDRSEALLRQLTDAIARVGKVEAALGEQQRALEQHEQQLSLRIDRSHASLEKQLDAATTHFAHRTEEVAGERKRAQAAAEEVRRAALAMRELVQQMRQFTHEVEAGLPEKAENALRALINQIEQEPGVLALALGNVGSFTGAMSKKLERDQ